MPIDGLLKESDFERTRKSREEEGWEFMGRVGLTRPQFSSEAKFEYVPYQTEIDIKTNYLKLAKQRDPTSDFEIDLMLDENTQKLTWLKKNSTDDEYRRFLENLNPEDKNYFVWVRKKSSGSSAPRRQSGQS